MSSILLFYTTEEVVNLVRQILTPGTKTADEEMFYLVESRTAVTFKTNVGVNEPFHTDFIGENEQACQEWALRHQDRCASAEHDIIAILDTRSSKDGTILIQKFFRQDPEDIELNAEEEYAPEGNVWHSWRVHHTKAFPIYTSLCYGDFEIVESVYYEHKTRFTDEHGVFDVDEAEMAVRGEGPAMPNL